jgi:predicted phosphodiesterase
MRYGIISDIHGNWEALEAVIAACRNEGARQIFCLGDIVGYGANPRECIDLIRNYNIPTVAGNHDWAAVRKFDPIDFQDFAKTAIFWTQTQLRPDDEEFLKSIPLVFNQSDLVLVHGTLNQPEQFHYLTDLTKAADTFYAMRPSVCFVGHTHVPQILIQQRRMVAYASGLAIEFKDDNKYIVNVGSVGQPRDGNPQASFGIFDPDLKRVQIKRVAYDIESAQRKILEAGLPDFLAKRLAVGQ